MRTENRARAMRVVLACAIDERPAAGRRKAVYFLEGLPFLQLSSQCMTQRPMPIKDATKSETQIYDSHMNNPVGHIVSFGGGTSRKSYFDDLPSLWLSSPSKTQRPIPSKEATRSEKQMYDNHMTAPIVIA